MIFFVCLLGILMLNFFFNVMINFMIFKEFVFKFFINFAFGVICVVFIFNCLVIIV